MRSKLDPSHITQMTYDQAANANRVKIADAEMSIELSHQDGDSVASHPAKLVASVLGCEAADNGTDVIPAIDCSSLREIRADVDGAGTIKIFVSPVDSGSFFYEVGGAGVMIKICARRIKIQSVDAIGDIHLVGRS